MQTAALTEPRRRSLAGLARVAGEHRVALSLLLLLLFTRALKDRLRAIVSADGPPGQVLETEERHAFFSPSSHLIRPFTHRSICRNAILSRRA
jgi:hypothetical protein